MQLMYVDESGDQGKFSGGNSEHYALSGLIVAQDDWNESLNRLKEFRKQIKVKYGLLLKDEIHASELIRISKTDSYRKISKQDRISILKQFVGIIPQIFNKSKLINIFFRKNDFTGDVDFQLLAWERLIQRFDNYLKISAKDKGIIISDNIDEKKIKNLLRKKRHFNLLKSNYGGTYRRLTDNIIEDIFIRDSRSSYFIQSVDTAVHCLYRKEFPKGSLKRYGINHFFNLLKPILLLEASKYDDDGIVRK